MTLEDRFPNQGEGMAYCDEHNEAYREEYDCKSCVEENRADMLRNLAKDKKACL